MIVTRSKELLRRIQVLEGIIIHQNKNDLMKEEIREQILMEIDDG